MRVRMLAAILSGLLAALALASPAAAQTPDFDGDGIDDLAIGVPREDLLVSRSEVPDAGIVHVIYGTSFGLAAGGNQLWSQASPGVLGTAQTGDDFGNVLAWGDFDADGFADLAIGVTGESAGGHAGAGGVNVLYGSAGGLSAAGDQLWTQANSGIPGDPQDGEHFGMSLTTGDFNGDDVDDLAIGVPDEKETGANGGVNVLYGSAAGLVSTGSQLWTADLVNCYPDPARCGDFGQDVAAGDFDGDGFEDLAIGAPLAWMSCWCEEPARGGSVIVLRGGPAGLSTAGQQLWNQNAPGIQNTAENDDGFGFAVTAGDLNADGFDDLGVGAPREDLSQTRGGLQLADVGVVHVIYGSAAGLTGAGSQVWHQNSPAVGESNEAGDFFGTRLAIGQFGRGPGADLAIDASGEDHGCRGIECTPNKNAGLVHVLYGSPDGLSAAGSQIWSQDAPGIEGSTAPEEVFGFMLGTGDFDGDGLEDLAASAYETVSGQAAAGAVHVIYATEDGLASAGDQLWHQASPGILDSPETLDFFSRVAGN